MGRSSRITSNGGPAGEATKGASSEGHKSVSRRKKDREENVYAFDEDDDGETKKKDSERRFKGVSVYEYELGDDFEDEEIDEDEAFEAEDYEKYGNIGTEGKKRGKGSADKESDEVDDDRELDDLFGDGGSAGSSDDDGRGAMDNDEANEAIANGMDADLAESLGLIAKRKVRGAAAARASVAEESEFAVGGNTNGSGRELQLSDLTQPLASSKLLSTSTATLIKHAQSNKASVPLLGASKAAVIRQEQYEVTKAEVTRWQPEVKKNREAVSLSFPLRSQPAPHVSTKTLTAELNPTTSLEADIASLLKGAGEENVQAFEALAMNNMSPEDVRARQAELAKMRSLLFFHEIKCRRIARIKSKKFAKVHKKKKGAKTNADEDDIEFEEGGDSEAADKRERARIKERMTLKHRNTSKWVTRQLHRGGGKEKGTRQAIEQQLRLAEDLKRKVDRLSGSSDDAAGASSGDDEAVDSLRQGVENHETDVQHKGLHAMAFMKRARDKGKAQALRLLEEIAAADAGEEAAHDDDNAERASGRRSFNITAATRKHASLGVADDRAGFHDDDDDGDGSSSAQNEAERAQTDAGRKRAKAAMTSASSSGTLLPLQGGKGMQTLHASLGGSTSLTSTGAVSVIPASASVVSGTSRSSRASSRAAVSSNADTGISNCSLPQTNAIAETATENGSTKRKRQQHHEGASDSNHASFPNQSTPELSSNPWLVHSSAAVSGHHRGNGNQSALSSAVLHPMPAADFVREKSNDEASADIQEAFAFAAPDNTEEFQAEKRAEIDADAPKMRAFVNLPGWGSWAGEGCVDKYKDTLEARHKARIQEAQAKAALARKDAGKAHVILNEKRNKKSIKYMADNFPHVFANREQYESSIRQPLGHEWNTLAAHRTLVQPAVTVKAGKMIKPIAVPKSKLRSVGAEKVKVVRKSFLK